VHNKIGPACRRRLFISADRGHFRRVGCCSTSLSSLGGVRRRKNGWARCYWWLGTSRSSRHTTRWFLVGLVFSRSGGGGSAQVVPASRALPVRVNAACVVSSVEPPRCRRCRRLVQHAFYFRFRFSAETASRRRQNAVVDVRVQVFLQLQLSHAHVTEIKQHVISAVKHLK